MTGPTPISLFDGETLEGWASIPRVYGTWSPGGRTVASVAASQGLTIPDHPEDHPARWSVEEGAIVGRQETPGCGYGGYLITRRAFGDFELELEAKPDWPADTGVMVRRRFDSWEGFQVLLDHRPHGGIGGFFGNGLASFSAVPFTVDAQPDDEGEPAGLRPADSGVGPTTAIGHRRALLSHAADVEDFLAVWRWGDWNHLRIRCVGELPRLTTWVNGLKVAELDTASIDWPGYDAAAVRRTLGARGHIALEVHDNDPVRGTERWGVDAACRWRNLWLTELA
jgi:hypothetical protein